MRFFRWLAFRHGALRFCEAHRWTYAAHCPICSTEAAICAGYLPG